MSENDENRSAVNRANNQTQFVQSLDKFIDSVVTMDHGASKKDIIVNFNNRLVTEFQANIEYHERLAQLYENEKDKAMFEFHSIKAQIYRLMMPQKTF